MTRTPLGFETLAERLHERLGSEWARWLAQESGLSPSGIDYAREMIDQQAGDALQAVRDGWYRTAAAVADDLYVIEIRPDPIECDVWRPFQELCHLLDAADALLATLEGRRGAAELARAARHDIDLLPILADWCEDNDYPAAGSELRRLRCLLREAERRL
jgi:hypothetical protein